MEENTYNSLGKDLMNKLRNKNGGKFPVTATRADVAWALGECNKDTAPYMISLGVKALERAGVRVQGVAESRTGDADFLISSAERGVPVSQALGHLREKDKDKKSDDDADDEDADDDDDTDEKNGKKKKNGNGNGNGKKKKEESWRPIKEYRERDMQDFIDNNRGELVAAIQRAAGPNSRVDDDEIELWINNDEGLYMWAQSEGVDLSG